MSDHSEQGDGSKDATAQQGRGALRIDRRLLELLVCPLTRTSLKYDETAQELISSSAYLAYPIRDGVPIMIPDEARELDR